MSTNDQQPQSSTNGPSHKRRRARKACIPCRQRKRKCDGASPCEMCSTYGYSCQYDEDDSPLAPFVVHPAKRSKAQEHEQVTSPNSTHHADSPATTSTKRRQRSNSPAYDGGLLDDNKSRYVGVSSAVAFPRVLGLELRSQNPPPLHSFGYNFGIRPEEKSAIIGNLTNFVSQEQLATYSEVYFATIAPVYEILDKQIYESRCRDHFKHPGKDQTFGAIAAGVVAFGSFLSTNQGHPQELDIVQFAKTVLEDPTCTRRPSIDQVIGWMLRTLYLRATTRPNNSWLASSITMHLVEALGMHEEENVLRLAVHSDSSARGYDSERLRRIFWLAWTNNIITSYEYGRSSVRFPQVTCENVTPTIGGHAHQQIRLAQIVPSPNTPYTPEVEPADYKEELYQRIKAVGEVPGDHPFIALTKADLVFCFYRKIRQQKFSPDGEVIDQVISAGNKAVEAAIHYIQEGRPFWNILGSVFQYTCVLLAIDTHASLANVNTAFRGLEAIVNAADTRLTREALTTARLLLKDTIKKKRQELSTLESADALVAQEDKDSICDQVANVEMPQDFELNLNWDQFFNESYQTWLGQSDMMGHTAWMNGTQQLPHQP